LICRTRSLGRSSRASLTIVALLAAVIVRLPAQGGATTEPVLYPGDAVRINVWRMPEMSGEFEVDAAGRLLHPLYDSVKVTEVPLSVAQTRLAAVLEQQQAGAQFTLQPLLRVAVEGEVQRPSIDRHPPETTIAQAIALSGGPTDRGSLERVRLVRGSTVTRLDLRNPAGAELHLPIRSGDRIIIDRRGRTFGDYFVPVISVLGTIASIANLVRRTRQ
jgi:polysaccharide export outer membrane protein